MSNPTSSLRERLKEFQSEMADRTISSPMEAVASTSDIFRLIQIILDSNE